ncbi:MAG TPA: PilZ domain-containing protein, partial [Polyangiales bacterium]
TTLDVGALANVHVTLPGGFEFKVPGRVHFVRDPMDMSDEAEPGMGIKFEALQADHRELILRFVRKRAPMFYDD